MSEKAPPPLPHSKEKGSRTASFRDQILVRLSIAAGGIGALVILLRVCGLLIPYNIPTKSMAPAIKAGDHVMMEGISYLFRKPARGDIAVYKATVASQAPMNTYRVSRIVGLPGESLSIKDGKLYINDKEMVLTNNEGRIRYDPSPIAPPTFMYNVLIPDHQYFLIGDNSTNSFDSRYWGFLPEGNIKGKIRWCYSPVQRAGSVQ